MNWDAIGAIGQMLGSLAVFVTLGYLAVQVKHASQEARRAISQNRAETVRQLLVTDATDERLIGILTKTFKALGGEPSGTILLLMQRAGLTYEEAWSITMREAAWWQYRSEIIRNVDALAPGDRVQFDRVTRASYSASPLGRLWYEGVRGVFDPHTVRYIDNLLAQPG